MRILLLALIGSLLLGVPGSALTLSHPSEALVGTWQVDLRPTPDAEPYYQEFEVFDVEGSELTGRFYGSEIVQGSINDDWGQVRFAFTTQDGSGIYHTAGVLDGDRLSGTTHSLGRNFLSVWTAERMR